MSVIENTKKLLSLAKPEWPFRSIKNFQQILSREKIYFISASLNVPFQTGSIKPEDTDLFSILDDSQISQIKKSPSCFFLFDYMKEGTGYKIYNYYQLITQSALQHNIPFNKIVFSSSNLLEQQAYDEWCSLNNIQDKFHIFTCNFWAATFENMKTIDQTVYFLRQKYKKDYLCLNRRIRNSRILSVFQLSKSSAYDKGFISCNTFDDSKVAVLSNILSRHYKEKLNLQEFQNFRNKLPLILDRDDFEVNWVDTMPDELFYSTIYSLVNETLIEGDFENTGPSLFYSEKTFKPMFYNHPVLIFGQANANKYLKNLGFRTYEKYFNLDFDSIPNSFERINQVIKEVEKISSLLGQLNMEQKIEWLLQDRTTLEYNQKQTIDTSFNDTIFEQFIKKIKEGL